MTPTADCDQCLLVNGRIRPPPTPRYIAKSNRINYDYQLYVANLHAGPERFGCVSTVIETKANYGHFLNEVGEPKAQFMLKEITGWRAAFFVQLNAIASTAPQGSLEWHFMDERVYVAAITQARLPASSARLTPFPHGLIV